MTNKQFEKKIKKMFRTQARAAAALGTTQQAISNWFTGRREVPLIVVKFLQCLEREAPLNEIAEGFVKNMRLSEKLRGLIKGEDK